MTDQLADLLCDFVKNTIIGQLSEFYKIGLISNGVWKKIARGAIINYYNSCYKSLILRNDIYVTENFDNFKKILGYSEICLLHILLWMTIATYKKLIETYKYESQSYSEFMTTMDNKIKNIITSIRETLKKSLSHQCTGIDITTCDPNEDLFVLEQR